MDARKSCGKDWRVSEIMDEILKDRLFYENSGGGVTFSGGECMLQMDFLESLLKTCHSHEIHTAVDTAGNVEFSRFERILPYTDLFLYDVKCITSELHKKNTGVTNQRILKNLKKLLAIRPESVWIRIPMIPGFNTNKEELHKIAEFLSANPPANKIELLPFHRLGETKRAGLGIPLDNMDTLMPTPKEMEYYEKIIKSGGAI